MWQWERPATTVCAPSIPAERAATGDQDGTEAMKLTLEEALIFQGFDPAYPLQGSRSKKFEQVGNAIPPALAYAVLAPLVGEVQ